MSGMTMPSAGGIPPGVGLAPPPSVSMPYLPEDRRPTEEELLVQQREQYLQDTGDDGETHDRHRTVDELQRDAERTRERVNDSVLELRERLGLDPDAAHAHGPFGPVRRHPLTVTVAAVGTATAAVIGVTVLRGHRKAEKQAVRASAADTAKSAVDDAIKAAQRRRRAAAKATRRRRKAVGKRLDAAKDVFGSAAKTMGRKRRKAMRRLTHR
ncbi:hypothetical protein [Glycomyces harbinensis]|uniref:DUF3618 domain-containing protein n=1 Tax=Glycomyces harbinensis TaxID=58114 RepID=A0A1G6SQA2_9ACTN|nr:hypothetical protein [Glycomyces harbinensis]SDD18366.1 hypothetical protein SAMN05216270_102198 [Glycomyces harbinensis]